MMSVDRKHKRTHGSRTITNILEDSFFLVIGPWW